ncbi:sensor histidine kinase [Actinomycetes bacterium NPDC127524]
MNNKVETHDSPKKGGFLKKLIQPIKTSIRVQVILAFAICILVSALAGFASSPFFVNTDRHRDFTEGIIAINERAAELDSQFQQMNQDINDLIIELGNENQVFKDKFLNSSLPRARESKDWLSVTTDEHSVYHLTRSDLIKFLINNPNQPKNLKVVLTNRDGAVLNKSKGVNDTKINLQAVKVNAKKKYVGMEHEKPPTITKIYPINLSGGQDYLIVTGVPKSTVFYTNETGVTPYLLGLIIFIICFYLITQRKMKEIEELAQGLMEVAKGNLHYRIRQKSRDELGSLASNINYMAYELNAMIEKQRQNEKLKDELITNVSHDLRTPLTSIMGYLRLVKDRQYHNQTQLDEYVGISYGKSEQLKKLVEDLFDFTRLANKGVQLKKEKVSLNKMLRQLIEELVPIAKEYNVRFIEELPSESIMIDIDPDQMVRAVENVFSNAIKYSTYPGTIHVEMSKNNNYVQIKVTNPCDTISEKEVERLFERFYRVDEARTSNKSGAGLGLSITKGIIELHGGTIHAEYKNNLIQLIINLPFL